MHAVLHGVAVAHIVEVYLGTALADALNTALALLELGGVPRKIQVDQGAHRLQVEALGGGVGADQDGYLSGAQRGGDRGARGMREDSRAQQSGLGRIGVE